MGFILMFSLFIFMFYFYFMYFYVFYFSVLLSYFNFHLFPLSRVPVTQFMRVTDNMTLSLTLIVCILWTV